MASGASWVMFMALFVGPRARDWRPPELAVQPTKADVRALEGLARQYVGRPYAMGGIGNPAFDCSGFVCRVFAEAGYALPRVSRDQARVGRDVALDALQPGDVLFFAERGRPISHVGLYLGGQKLIHASSGQGRVVVADLGRSWFQKRLVAARRMLGGALEANPLLASAPVEWVEHAGALRLPATLRRPAEGPPFSFGPESFSVRPSGVSVTALWATEDGRYGLSLAPELSLQFEGVGLGFRLGLPLRLSRDGGWRAGSLRGARGVSRFLRAFSLGLLGADLELRLTRKADLSLLGGGLVAHWMPSQAVRGLPGFTQARTPLSFFGRVRRKSFELQSLVDDVVDPALFGAGVLFPWGQGRVAVGAGAVTDQRAEFLGGQRTVSALEAQAGFALVRGPTVFLKAVLHGSLIRALSDFGGTGSLEARLRVRASRSGATRLGVSARARLLGPHALASLFGPTYAAAKSLHLEALETLETRPALGGTVSLVHGRFSLGGTFESGTGTGRHPMDRFLWVFMNAHDLSLGRNMSWDLEGVYAVRGLGNRTNDVHVMQALLRLRLNAWLSTELRLRRGASFEGGLGLRLAWSP